MRVIYFKCVSKFVHMRESWQPCNVIKIYTPKCTIFSKFSRVHVAYASEPPAYMSPNKL